MNVRCVFQLILVFRKLIIKVLLNDFIEQDWAIDIPNKIRCNVFLVIMKGIAVVTTLKRPIYQIFD